MSALAGSLAMLALTACGGGSSTGTTDDGTSPFDDPSTLRVLQVTLDVPQRLQRLGIALDATVTAGGVQKTMQPVGNGFESTLDLPTGQQIQVNVAVRRADDDLLLAAADALAWLSDEGAALSVPEQRFSYDFDLDGDGIDNIMELEIGSSPSAISSDLDGDGLPDDIDPDDNNNGIDDDKEDADGDGWPDNVDAFPTISWEWQDSDGDGIGDNQDEDDDNNGIADRREGSQVIVPYVDNASVVIDGRWDAYWDDASQTYHDEWAKATENDSFENYLELSNLLIDNAGRYDNQDYYWSGTNFAMMHDGVYLYVRVVSHNEQLENWFNDSADPWQDDSVELYFDVNYDRLDTYGATDYQRIFRFRDTVEEPTEDGYYSAGGMVSEYMTSYRHENASPDVYEQVYEIRVSLASIGLEPGATFGLEVSSNDDDDGGDRDLKWGWWVPSGSDIAWQQPSAFGKAKLQPLD